MPKRQKHLHICSLWWLFAFIYCQVSFIFGRSKLTSRFPKRPPSNSSVYSELSQSNMYIVFSRSLLTELCFKNFWKTTNSQVYSTTEWIWIFRSCESLNLTCVCCASTNQLNAKSEKARGAVKIQLVFFSSLSLFSFILLISNHMIFLVQLEINKHL